MSRVHLHIPAFNSGELSPLMRARFGVEKLTSGCAKLRNFIPHVHGPAFRRPGLEFMGLSASNDTKSRLVGFNFSATTAFILELADEEFRVWSNGELVTLDTPVTWPYSATENFALQIAQINDVCYIVHPDHPPRKLTRVSDTNWTLAEVSWKWPALLDENIEATTIACSATSGTGATLTASASTFVAGHVGAYFQIAHRRETAFTELSYSGGSSFIAASSTAMRIVGKWDFFTYGTWATTVYLERKNAAGTWDVVRTWVGKSDRNIIASGSEDEECELRLRIAAGTYSTNCRFILEAADAKVYGLVKITAVTNGTTATADVVSSLQSTDATVFWTEGAWSPYRGYPRAVALHGQRAWYAGTTKEPQRIWASVIGDIENFRRSSLDDASISFVPASQEANRVCWMASQGKDLIIGTTGDEWTVNGGDAAITPTNIQSERQSRYGSEVLPAQMVNEALAFFQRGGRKVRRVAPRSAADAWAANDMTVLAEHITDSGIVQSAFSSNPNSILWAVTNDGRLIGLTMETEQNVYAWHDQRTDGTIESVAVVYGADADEVWVSCERDGVRTIERFDTLVWQRDFSDQSRLIYLDSAVRTEDDDEMTEITGLDHLEGKTVSVLGDGAEQEQQVVSSGAITLANPARKVIVGLPFESIYQCFPQEVPLQDGTAQNAVWKVSRVGVYVYDTLGGEIADSEDSTYSEALNFRDLTMTMDAAPSLYTGWKFKAIDARTRENVEIVVRQNAPLPFNLGSVTLELDVSRS